MTTGQEKQTGTRPVARHRTTIAIVPREVFSTTGRTMEIVGRHSPDVPTVVVDGGSPRRIRREIQDHAARQGWSVRRTPHVLTPLEARQAAVRGVDTEFIAIIDNDIIVPPGWLQTLELCALDTGADVVSPVVGFGAPPDGTVHASVGPCHIEEVAGRRRFVEGHGESDERAIDVASRLARTPTENVEFHCLLIRTEIVERIGGFDRDLPALWDHNDFSLRVTAAGGTMWLEPACVVFYAPPRRATVTDLPFFLLRWSPEWVRRSSERLRSYWDLPEDDERLAWAEPWSTTHRRRVFLGYTRSLRRLGRFGHRLERLLIRISDRVLTPLLTRRALSLRRAAGSEPRHPTGTRRDGATARRTRP